MPPILSVFLLAEKMPVRPPPMGEKIYIFIASIHVFIESHSRQLGYSLKPNKADLNSKKKSTQSLNFVRNDLG